jgi:hypothetical protein
LGFCPFRQERGRPIRVRRPTVRNLTAESVRAPRPVAQDAANTAVRWDGRLPLDRSLPGRTGGWASGACGRESAARPVTPGRSEGRGVARVGAHSSTPVEGPIPDAHPFRPSCCGGIFGELEPTPKSIRPSFRHPGAEFPPIESLSTLVLASCNSSHVPGLFLRVNADKVHYVKSDKWVGLADEAHRLRLPCRSAALRRTATTSSNGRRRADRVCKRARTNSRELRSSTRSGHGQCHRPHIQTGSPYGSTEVTESSLVRSNPRW